MDGGIPQGREPLKVRRLGLDFAGARRRYWLAGYRFPSMEVNGVNLLFPLGERFFVRSVLRYRDRLEDPALREAIKGFAGQEGEHAKAHEAYFEALRAQGFELEPFLRFYERVGYRWIEPAAPHWLSLATTAAAEHYTAILAEMALEYRFFDRADPELRRLLYWHSVEELEHKSVAFEVLAKAEPGYLKRMAGLAMATTLLGTFWFLAARELLKQDARLPREEENPEPLPADKHGPLQAFARGLREYVRPGFHPDARDHRPLVARALEELGLR